MKDDECHYSHSKLERKESSPPTTSRPKSVTVTNKTGSEASKTLETDGSLQSMLRNLLLSNKDLETRMVRIESRLVQLLLHIGATPITKGNNNG